MKKRRVKRVIDNKIFLVLIAVVLIVGCTIGSTVAWLVATSKPVINTFTYGDIDITLEEKKVGPFKIIPGKDIDKDPKVTVLANSEDCWLFIKVEEANWPTFKEDDGTNSKVSYSIETGWTPLEDTANVYYREVNADTADQSFDVLAGNKVTVSENLTKVDIDTVKESTPTLTITPYAIQQDGIDNVATAWEKAQASTATAP